MLGCADHDAAIAEDNGKLRQVSAASGAERYLCGSNVEYPFFCTLQEAKALMKQKKIELPELNQADLQRACRTPAVLLERVTRLAGGHRAGQ